MSVMTLVAVCFIVIICFLFYRRFVVVPFVVGCVWYGMIAFTKWEWFPQIGLFSPEERLIWLGALVGFELIALLTLLLWEETE